LGGWDNGTAKFQPDLILSSAKSFFTLNNIPSSQYYLETTSAKYFEAFL
jgi:hypothetical protein